MVSRIFEEVGRSFAVLPYGGFAALGFLAPDEVPRAAVPIFETVQEALAEPLARAAAHQDELRRMKVQRLGRLYEERLGLAKGVRSSSVGDIPYAAMVAFPLTLFRGERLETFGILPSLYRNLERCDRDRAAQKIRSRLDDEARSAANFGLASRFSGRRFSKEEARAAARHYGVRSAMVDFSYDPAVAAYFGHPPLNAREREIASKEGAAIGIIYALDFARLAQVFPMQGWKTVGETEFELTFYGVGNALRIPYDAADAAGEKRQQRELVLGLPPSMANHKIVLRGVMVPQIRRIAAQLGTFLEVRITHPDDWMDAMKLWYILDFMAEKWCYLRRDHQFESPELRLTERDLFPRDSPLLRIAARSAARYRD